MYCGNCNKQIPETCGFCPYCGDKTIRYVKPQNNNIQSQQESLARPKGLLKVPKIKNYSILAIIAVFACLFIVLKISNGASSLEEVVLKDIGASSPELAVRNILKASQTGDVEKIIKYSTYNSYCQQKLGNKEYDLAKVKEVLAGGYELDIANGGQEDGYEIKKIEYPKEQEYKEYMSQLEEYEYTTENVEDIALAVLVESFDDYQISDYIYCLKIGGRWFVSTELNYPG